MSKFWLPNCWLNKVIPHQTRLMRDQKWIKLILTRDQKYIKVVLMVVWREIRVLCQRCLYVEQPGQWPGGVPVGEGSPVYLMRDQFGCSFDAWSKRLFDVVFNVVFNDVYYVVHTLYIRCTNVVQRRARAGVNPMWNIHRNSSEWSYQIIPKTLRQSVLAFNFCF